MGDAYSEMTKLAEKAQSKQALADYSQQQRKAIAINKVEYCRLGDLVDMLGADKPVRIEHCIAPTTSVVTHAEIQGTVSFLLRVSGSEYNVVMGMHEPAFALADLDEVDAALRAVDDDG